MKKLTQAQVDLVRIAYFESMLTGYLGKENPEVDRYHKGRKSFTYEDRENEILVTDEWITGEHLINAPGSVVISIHGQPVWYMDYTGKYPNKVMHILKPALRQTCKAKSFIGGRGPNYYVLDDLTYENFQSGGFNEFSGMERIIDNIRGVELGTHEYWGGLLLRVK